MFEKLKQRIHVANMIPCKCGSGGNHWNVKDRLDGLVCEAEIVCDDCKQVVNYWAYGDLQYPETYTQLLGQKLYKLRRYLKELLC